MNCRTDTLRERWPILTITSTGQQIERLHRPDDAGDHRGHGRCNADDEVRLSLRVQEGGSVRVLTSRQAKIRLTTMPREASGLQRDGGLLTLRLFESKNPSSRPVTALLLALAPQCNAPWTSA